MTDAYARPFDPATSHEAAEKMQFTNKEKIVYDVLVATGVPMTSLCIMRYLKSQYGGDAFAWSVSPRLKPLERKGLIRRAGRKLVLNSSGNPAELTAWVVVKLPT